MAEMLKDLGRSEAQAWDVVDAVANGSWTLPDLYAAWKRCGGSLFKLRELMADTPLAGLVAPYLSSLGRKVAPDTVAHYRVHLNALVEALPHRSGLTVGNLEAWVTALPYAAGTQRKYAAAASGFCAWLVRQGALPTNVMRDVPKPKGKARDRWLSSADAQRLADAQPEPYRSLSIVLHGTGLDVSAALGLRREQFLSDGTLTCIRPKSRKRHTVVVAGWALPTLRELCRGKLPNARLFTGIDRWRANDRHREACQVCGIADYWMRDARHSYAVRLAQAGMPMAQIAECLGNSVAMVTGIYTVHAPAVSDMLGWERLAQARDVG
jgi:integrase